MFQHQPKIGFFGGGNGAESISDLARRSGLDYYISCSDNGYSSGEIQIYVQKNYGVVIIPPGDPRRILAALSPYLCDIDPRRSAWEYRFLSDREGPLNFQDAIDIIRKENPEIEIPEIFDGFNNLNIDLGPIKGHPLGNLVLAMAMLNSSGKRSNIDGIKYVTKLLECRGRIIPVFPRYTTLVYTDTKGRTFRGEHTLESLQQPSYPVDVVEIDPPLGYNPEFLESLRDRERITVFGPTSWIANTRACLPNNAEGLSEVTRLILEKPRGLSSPLMTEWRQTASTDGQWTGDKLLIELGKVLGIDDGKVVDFVIIPGPYTFDYNGIRDAYDRERSTPLQWPESNLRESGILCITQESLVVVRNIVDRGKEKVVLRDDPVRHADAVLSACEQITRR